MTPQEQQEQRADFAKAYPDLSSDLNMHEAGAISALESIEARHKWSVWQKAWQAAQAQQAERLRVATPVWRCFHCDETFNTKDSAREHFGPTLLQQPACQIDVAEYRRMEAIHRRHCEEDTDLHREIHKAEAKGAERAMRAEEAGYAKGLGDYAKLMDAAKLAVLALKNHTEQTRPLLQTEQVILALKAAGVEP